MINSSAENLPIIIGGFYRSGTSLLRRLLDSHTRIHCAPEIKFFKDFHGDYLKDELRHVRFFATLASLGLSEEERLMLFGGAFVKSHEMAAARAGKARWADKNPENVLYLEQWRRLLPGGFVFVHMIRDPLDALASLREIGFQKTVPAALVDKAKLLKTFMDAGMYYSERHPDSSVVVSYEELVREPEKTLTRLFAFLGENFEQEILARFMLPERGSGIEDPKVGKTSIVHQDSIGRGRKDFSRREVADIYSVLGK
jgi:protein-tyrosine sulfotransferase